MYSIEQDGGIIDENHPTLREAIAAAKRLKVEGRFQIVRTTRELIMETTI